MYHLLYYVPAKYSIIYAAFRILSFLHQTKTHFFISSINQSISFQIFLSNSSLSNTIITNTRYSLCFKFIILSFSGFSIVWCRICVQIWRLVIMLVIVNCWDCAEEGNNSNKNMDSARSWFQKFQPRDKLRGGSTRKKDDFNNGGDEPSGPVDEAALSNITKQKVAAAKQYIENHYKEQMKSLQERRERCVSSFHQCSIVHFMRKLHVILISCSQFNDSIFIADSID